VFRKSKIAFLNVVNENVILRNLCSSPLILSEDFLFTILGVDFEKGEFCALSSFKVFTKDFL